MPHLTRETVDQAISEIKKEIKDFPISRKALGKFKDDEVDYIYSTSINVEGNYYLKFIPAILKKLQLKNILELGNREGFSTLCIWDHLPSDGIFTSVDIVKDLRFCPKELFEDSRLRLVYGDVSNPAIYNNEYPKDVEFMFLDTIHYNYQVTDEFEVNQHFLADRALVAIDDINLNDKRKFFDALPYQKWDLTDFCHCSGWGLFLYERKNNLSYEERIFEAYKAGLKIFIRKYNEEMHTVELLERKKITSVAKRSIKKISPLYRSIIFLKNKFIDKSLYIKK